MKALPRSAAWSIPALFSWALQMALFASCNSPSMTQERDANAPATAASSCSTHEERCNGRDDDCDSIIDENADSSCGIAHATATCVRGACVIERCSNGYFNCNGVNWDGCEAKAPCECSSDQRGCVQPDASAVEAEAPDAAAVPSMSQRTGTPSAADASTPPMAAMPSPTGQGGAGSGGAAQPAAEGGQGGRTGRGVRFGQGGRTSDPDADGGLTGDAGLATASCEPERCDGKDNDCDQKVDEDGACSCAQAAPTGQGEACDRCVCDQCAEALDNCTGTSDDEWNMLCGNVLRCFGRSVQAGLCTGSDSDCYQNGNGPCAAEFKSAFTRGFMCTSNPVRVPCGGLTRVRLECYKTKCSAFCKS